MIGSGIGLSRAFWITTNAVLKTPVSKHTMQNFGCQVIGNPSFCLVAFGVVPGRRYTAGLKTATPTKADLIYHTIYAYFQFTLAYINMVPGIAKKLSYCETRRSRVIIFARTRHLLWQFSPVLLSVISCGGEKYAKNLTLSGRAWAEVLWFMRSFNRIVCVHF